MILRRPCIGNCRVRLGDRCVTPLCSPPVSSGKVRMVNVENAPFKTPLSPAISPINVAKELHPSEKEDEHNQSLNFGLILLICPPLRSVSKGGTSANENVCATSKLTLFVKAGVAKLPRHKSRHHGPQSNRFSKHRYLFHKLRKSFPLTNNSGLLKKPAKSASLKPFFLLLKSYASIYSQYQHFFFNTISTIGWIPCQIHHLKICVDLSTAV